MQPRDEETIGMFRTERYTEGKKRERTSVRVAEVGRDDEDTTI